MSRRVIQVLKYGWKHSDQVRIVQHKGFAYRVRIFFDMLYCFKAYKMWSNQYLKEDFYLLHKPERKIVGKKYHEIGLERDLWQADFIDNKKFLSRYSKMKYEISRNRDKRSRAYRKRYNIGDNLLVENDVNISRQHYLPGTLKIGNNVLLAKHVFIDYSGDVVIKDNVQLTNGVIVESHHHAFHSDYRASRNEIIPTKILIEEGAVIGSRAIILSSCHFIGKHARVGAGAVVTKDVPDYAVVAGVPARVIKFMNE